MYFFPPNKEMTVTFIVTMWVILVMAGVGCWNTGKYVFSHVHIEIK